MKWLTLFLCVLAMPLAAQETPKIYPFPSVMLCGLYNNGDRMLEEYGEIPFVEGDAQVMSPNPGQAYSGRIRIFVDPNDYSYTIFFDLEDELTCLLTTGEKLEPIVQGSPL